MPEHFDAVKERFDPENWVWLDSEELAKREQCSPAEMESHLKEHYTELDFSDLMSARVEVPCPVLVLADQQEGRPIIRVFSFKHKLNRHNCLDIREARAHVT